MKKKNLLLIFCIFLLIALLTACGNKEDKNHLSYLKESEDYFQIIQPRFSVIAQDGKRINVDVYVELISKFSYKSNGSLGPGYENGSDLNIYISGDSINGKMKYSSYSWIEGFGGRGPCEVQTNPIDFWIPDVQQESRTIITINTSTVFVVQVREHLVTAWAVPPYHIEK